MKDPPVLSDGGEILSGWGIQVRARLRLIKPASSTDGGYVDTAVSPAATGYISKIESVKMEKVEKMALVKVTKSIIKWSRRV